MSNQKVWVEVQNGYRLPCPADCEKEIHDRMLACWKENPRERAGFRGLTAYFRNRSFALGTIEPYELAPTRLRGKLGSMAEENTSRAATLIAEAVKEGKQNVSGWRSSKANSGKKKPASRSSSLTSVTDKKPASSSKSNSSMQMSQKRQSEVSEAEFGAGENYVDFMGKVRLCVCVCIVCVCCVCVCV
jgi:hypothetical protein